MDEGLKVAQDFSRIYTNEWKEARGSLSNEKHEEEIIYLLMRIVRGVQDTCTLDQNKNGLPESIAKEYIQHNLPSSLQRDQITNPLRSYIYSCIKCISSMCTLTDPLEIFWIPKGEVIDTEKFDHEAGKGRGQICDWTIWPAVVRGDGTVVKKGIVTPI